MLLGLDAPCRLGFQGGGEGAEYVQIPLEVRGFVLELRIATAARDEVPEHADDSNGDRSDGRVEGVGRHIRAA